MQKIFTRSIPNQEATRQFAKDLCENYLPSDKPFTLFLEGGLGAGKTFIATEILHYHGIKDHITSPTYALVNEYKNPNFNFAHWDFYRLEDANDFFARGFQDLAGEGNTIHLVEWPERLNPEAKGAFGNQKFVLKIEFGIGVGLRKVKLLQSQ